MKPLIEHINDSAHNELFCMKLAKLVGINVPEVYLHFVNNTLYCLIVNDVTVEKLGELLKENPRCLLMVCDELTGFLANLERKEYQSDRAFYLKAFNGNQSHTYDRIGRGTIHIPNATLSIIGGIQPSRLIPLIQAMHRGTNDDGLLQRLQMLILCFSSKSLLENVRQALQYDRMVLTRASTKRMYFRLFLF